MTFTFNSTVSDPAANSYISVEDADDYFAGKWKASSYDDLDTEQKQQLLVTATRRLETFKFAGDIADPSQALQWPRKDLIDARGVAVPSDAMPRFLDFAVCEMANWILTEEDRMVSDTDLSQLEKFKAGPLDLTFKPRAQDFPYYVMDLLDMISPGVVLSTGKSTAATRIYR